jgi:tetratricopeptide (TPR) repeat protein
MGVYATDEQQMNPVPEAAGSLDTALAHAERLLAANPALAAEQAGEIIKVVGPHPRARLLLAGARRRIGDVAGAAELLEALCREQPRWAAAQLELGITLGELGRGRDAVTALTHAARLAPTLPGVWRRLGDQLSLEGDEAGSSRAYSRHVEASIAEPQLVLAARALHADRLADSEQICRRWLKRHPTDVTAMRLLADTGMRLGHFADACALLQRALELAPDFHVARHNLALCLLRLNRMDEALEQSRLLLARDPDNANLRVLLAGILVRVGRFDEAIGIYEDILARYPRQPRAQMSYGHALKTVGRQADAIAAYRRSLEIDPGLGESWWSLANLKTFRFDDSDMAAMRAQLAASPAHGEDLEHLCFALGKALEDRRDFDASFAFYQRGNSLRRQHVPYSAAGHRERVQRVMDCLDAGFFAAHRGDGCPAPDPIFIVGLPRAGSTLIEQILASHSQVDGTTELPDIIALARRIGGEKKRGDRSRYPEALLQLDAGELRALGEEYLARTRVQRGDRPFFIDKMPNNFLHAGFIHLILPNARIIDARRHPLSCCVSVFKQLFARGQAFSYDLADIGAYYRDYVALMDHWDRVIPGRILRICHDDMVTDTEAQVSRLLDFCRLPFEPACLRFYETERPVRTASSEQVRQPINADGLGQWRNFAHHLAPLIDALGPELSAHPQRQERRSEPIGVP